MAVSLKVGADSVDATELFPLPRRPRQALQNLYDVAPDSQCFLVQEPDEQRPPALTVVVNWPALLRKQAP